MHPFFRGSLILLSVCLLREAAEVYSNKTVGITLEMSPQGKALEIHTEAMDWETKAEPLWKKTSQHFAGSAPKSQKHAVAFIDAERYRGAKSVWELSEQPILKKKGITTEVIDVNDKSKITACQ